MVFQYPQHSKVSILEEILQKHRNVDIRVYAFKVKPSYRIE